MPQILELDYPMTPSSPLKPVLPSDDDQPKTNKQMSAFSPSDIFLDSQARRSRLYTYDDRAAHAAGQFEWEKWAIGIVVAVVFINGLYRFLLIPAGFVE